MIVVDSSVWLDLFNIDGYRRNLAKEFFKMIESKDIPILEPKVFEVALNTGCRAIDSYFIALTKLTNSFLVSNDRIQVRNAKKFEVDSYYLLEDIEKLRIDIQKW